MKLAPTQKTSKVSQDIRWAGMTSISYNRGYTCGLNGTTVESTDIMFIAGYIAACNDKEEAK